MKALAQRWRATMEVKCGKQSVFYLVMYRGQCITRNYLGLCPSMAFLGLHLYFFISYLPFLCCEQELCTSGNIYQMIIKHLKTDWKINGNYFQQVILPLYSLSMWWSHSFIQLHFILFVNSKLFTYNYCESITLHEMNYQTIFRL